MVFLRQNKIAQLFSKCVRLNSYSWCHDLHSSQTHHWLQKRSFRGSVLCQNLPGGEVWSYGRSNSDVQQKMLKRLEEYEEASSLGGMVSWRPWGGFLVLALWWRWVNVSWYRFLWRKFGSICDCNSTGCLYLKCMIIQPDWLTQCLSLLPSPTGYVAFCPSTVGEFTFSLKCGSQKHPQLTWLPQKSTLKSRTKQSNNWPIFQQKMGLKKPFGWTWLGVSQPWGFDGLKG